MIKKIRARIVGDELIKGSFILFVMINVFNLFNYIFHFSMARLLGPEEYGILAVLFSFLYIFSIPTESIQNIITSYTSRLNAKNEYGKIKCLFLKSIKKSIILSILIFILYLPIAYLISPLIKVDFLLLAITGLFIFLFTSTPITRGVIQGQKKFILLGMNMISEGFLKVVLGISAVLIGWKVYGAIFAVILACVFALIFGVFSIRGLLKGRNEEAGFEGIYNYSIPYFFTAICITLMYSLDVIFAKRFFSEETAGIYAVISMLGKMIFFGTLAVGKAMLPLTSEKHESGEKTGFLLAKSLKIIGLISILALFFYLLFPKLIIAILFGSKYLSGSNILFFVGLSFTFLSFTNIIMLYKVSTKKIRNTPFFLIFVLIEITLFIFFHSTLLQFSLSFLFSSLIFFLASLFLLIKPKDKK